MDERVATTSRAGSRRAALVALALALALLPLVAVAAGMLWPSVPPTVASVRDVPREPGEVRHFRHDGIHGWLVRRPDGGLDAFSARSTHRGCFVDLVAPEVGRTAWAAHLVAEHGDTGFVDICFHWTWTLDGDLIWGGASRGLDRFEVTETAGRADVHLGRVTLGACPPGRLAGRHCSTPGQPREAPPRGGLGLRPYNVPPALVR